MKAQRLKVRKKPEKEQRLIPDASLLRVQFGGRALFNIVAVIKRGKSPGRENGPELVRLTWRTERLTCDPCRFKSGDAQLRCPMV